MTIKLKGEEDLKNMTCIEKVKFYTSLFLGITAVLSLFVFLFLIPFIVDPSITAILANFDTVPVACITAKHIYKEGLSNCTWTSCKEGCTSITPRCHQIYVNYSLTPYIQWKNNDLSAREIKWINGPVKFFVNTFGCGYPPRINCTEFTKHYGTEREDVIFPCYYSKRYPNERVVAHFNWNETMGKLLMAIIIPNGLFILSVCVLSYWYCWPTLYDYRHKILSTTYATFHSENITSSKKSKIIKSHVRYLDRNQEKHSLVRNRLHNMINDDEDDEDYYHDYDYDTD